jgi:hypothetical protein
MPTVNPDLAPLVGNLRSLSIGLSATDTNERVEPFRSIPDERPGLRTWTSSALIPGSRMM